MQALYRRGVDRLNFGSFEEARADLLEVVQLEPSGYPSLACPDTYMT